MLGLGSLLVFTLFEEILIHGFGFIFERFDIIMLVCD